MISSLLTTTAVVLVFSVGMLAGNGDLRDKGMMAPMTSLFFAWLAWALFMLPTLYWQKRNSRLLDAASFAALGAGLGSLLPLFFFVTWGPEWFFVWRGGQCIALSLLSIPAGAVIGGLQGHRQTRGQREAQARATSVRRTHTV